MYIANEPLVSDSDLHRYFCGCFVLDPHTGWAGSVNSLSHGVAVLMLFTPSGDVVERVYTDEMAAPFHRLDTYSTPDLGWRNTARGVVYLERNITSGGARGLTHQRVVRRYPSHIEADKPLVYSPNVDSLQIVKLVFSAPSQRSLADALPTLAAGRHVVLNNKLAALRVDGAPEFVLVYRTAVVGYGVLGSQPKLALSAPRVRKLLGDCDGIEVTTV